MLLFIGLLHRRLHILLRRGRLHPLLRWRCGSPRWWCVRPWRLRRWVCLGDGAALTVARLRRWVCLGDVAALTVAGVRRWVRLGNVAALTVAGRRRSTSAPGSALRAFAVDNGPARQFHDLSRGRALRQACASAARPPIPPFGRMSPGHPESIGSYSCSPSLRGSQPGSNGRRTRPLLCPLP